MKTCRLAHTLTSSSEKPNSTDRWAHARYLKEVNFTLKFIDPKAFALIKFTQIILFIIHFHSYMIHNSSHKVNFGKSLIGCHTQNFCRQQFTQNFCRQNSFKTSAVRNSLRTSAVKNSLKTSAIKNLLKTSAVINFVDAKLATFGTQFVDAKLATFGTQFRRRKTVPAVP